MVYYVRFFGKDKMITLRKDGKYYHMINSLTLPIFLFMVISVSIVLCMFIKYVILERRKDK